MRVIKIVGKKEFLPFVSKNAEERDFMVNAVKEMLLAKCKEIFKDFCKEAPKKESEIFGMPPKDAIVYYEEFDKLTLKTNNIQAWLLNDDRLNELENPNQEVNLGNPQTRKMYFEQASFRFRIEPDESTAYYSYTYGPRFGRGFIAQIGRNGDSPYLGKERMQWIS